ncbi:PREDICTED: uncharacterized protein LOC109238828 [Nicotiana attenuata]|uniref:uncharacterized protein LOC109238828 n=1 Tax=Nicotiana attenuata TaxID=49451 RepID=UPI00090479DF|nr:PREDICTED: uncharacterized protein LOC109238828 [Nicotiana attenuata]
MAGNEEHAVIEAARPNLANMTQAITKSLRSRILGFQQWDGETLRQAWEIYKKLLKDCPDHCQTDEVLGHTFVDGLDETSKMNFHSAYGGSCMARPYSEIQLILNNFTADENNWQGDGESRRALKQKADGVIELDDFSTMRADIEKLANQMLHPRPDKSACTIWNTYNPNCKNDPNFSWGGNQITQNHYRPQGNFNQPQKPPQHVEESTNDLLKKLLLDNQQLRIDFRNLERQMGQLASNQNTRPAGALSSDTEKNSQVNVVRLRNGRELEKVPKKRRDKPILEGNLIPKATHESKKDDAS